MRDMVPFRRRGEVTPSDFFKGFFGRDLIEEFFDNRFLSADFRGGFCADVKESDKEYIIEAELPGYGKDDIEINLVDERLTISANQNKEINEKGENYIRRERRYGQVSRSFIVSGVKNEDVKAEYNNGVLKITLPKAEEQKKKTTRIDIH